jgi:hypothetical protein
LGSAPETEIETNLFRLKQQLEAAQPHRARRFRLSFVDFAPHAVGRDAFRLQNFNQKQERLHEDLLRP